MFLGSPSEFRNDYSQGPAILTRNPDAVFFDTDRIAAGFLNFAMERNIAIPGKIAVIGFDDDLICRI